MDAEGGVGDDRVVASGGYALGRLWRAIETATTHDDPEVRARADRKALAWEAVLDGMRSGTLTVGSRTPVADTPAWVTLEVVHGGVATGRYVAERPLDEAERALLDALPPASDPAATDRMRLNTWFLTDDGLARLEQALADGSYVVEVPEDAALLTVAWLVSHGHAGAALDLVAELFPLMDRLRFSPTLTDAPSTRSAVVHVRSVGQVAAQLRAVRTPRQVAAMNEALLVWRPLYDELVGLWLETVDDDWPCARWPADWAQRRTRWLADYRRAATAHTFCGDHRRPRSNFTILRSALEACERDSGQLTGRDVGRVRLVLRRSVERWGAPGSSQLRGLRARQAAWAQRPTNDRLAAVVADRLDRVPADAGLVDPTQAVTPVHVGDGEVDVPPAIVRKVERAREAPVDELVAARIIPSSEVLATVLPQMTSEVAAADFPDPVLRELHARTYAAFRRRRSLLLLHLEHQVRIDELPWVRAVEPVRRATPDTRDAAARALREATSLTLTSFPQTILPNRMVGELAALAKAAHLDIPFVEETAADIFMGTFTVKWRKAAALASSALSGTLYARYYDLPPATMWDRAGAGRVRPRTTRWGTPVAAEFARLCEQRAREAHAGDGSFVARNGTVIEQAQILTTHNLAPLVERLDLRDDLGGRAAALASTAFDWIVREQNTHHGSWRSELQMVKNTAYAWRQAIFFLSLAPEAEWGEAIGSLRAAVASGERAWQARFEPAVAGLERVVGGGRFDASGAAGDGRRFLGWSVGRHWMLPASGRASTDS